jgi:hypothetical protein
VAAAAQPALLHKLLLLPRRQHKQPLQQEQPQTWPQPRTAAATAAATPAVAVEPCRLVVLLLLLLLLLLLTAQTATAMVQRGMDVQAGYTSAARVLVNCCVSFLLMP